jgi:hypothetical protein
MAFDMFDCYCDGQPVENFHGLRPHVVIRAYARCSFHIVGDARRGTLANGFIINMDDYVYVGIAACLNIIKFAYYYEMNGNGK